jgi:1-acyl-sn-glycerol-3-phosphate acyltransferase
MIPWFYRLIRAITVGLLTLLFNVRYEGLEHIPKSGGYVVLSNHVHLTDPVALVAKIAGNPFIAKSEFFKNPLLGAAFRWLGAVCIERGTADKNALVTRRSLCGTAACSAFSPRARATGPACPAGRKRGRIFIAQAAQSDVLPCALIYEHPLRFRSRVTVRFGPVISYQRIAFDGDAMRSVRHVTSVVWSEVVNLLEVRENAS